MELSASPIFEAQAELGEGPVWDNQKSVLHWLDINNSKIFTYDVQSGLSTFIQLNEKPGCMVPRASGGVVVALPKQFVALDLETYTGPESLQILASLEGEANLPNRMNDGKCDPAGRFWCGSMNLEEKNPTAKFWMMDKDYALTEKLTGVTISNGLAWSADAKTLYYIDTPSGRLDAFNYDIASGALSNRRVAFENHWGGHFDGMTIDADDNLYIAIWSGGCILKINPQSGELIYKIKVPGVKNVSCCTFGGPELKDLFITSSAKGADFGEEPHAGALFHIELPGSQGLPPFTFAG